MTVSLEAMPEILVFKTGTLDDADALNSCKPGVEIYTKDRPSSFEPIPGTAQKEAS